MPKMISSVYFSGGNRAYPQPQVVEVQGQIGDVALLHPFMLHANSPNCGVAPCIICNPCVRLRDPMNLERMNADDYSPVELAIVLALTATG